MSDWLGLAFILLLVVVGLVASARLGAPRKQISEEEFERRVREGQRSQAAMFALQQLLHPKAAKAVEVQQDFKHGYYRKKRTAGEGEDDLADDVLTPAESRTGAAESAGDINSEQAEESDA